MNVRATNVPNILQAAAEQRLKIKAQQQETLLKLREANLKDRELNMNIIRSTALNREMDRRTTLLEQEYLDSRAAMRGAQSRELEGMAAKGGRTRPIEGGYQGSDGKWYTNSAAFEDKYELAPGSIKREGNTNQIRNWDAPGSATTLARGKGPRRARNVDNGNAWENWEPLTVRTAREARENNPPVSAPPAAPGVKKIIYKDRIQGIDPAMG